ncbi:DUF2975 domain-containing protein [Kitasatospora sp. NPDC052896]|uniref:DUF2975 domain-containing protein n=1 Tax=Kitasatospora sp. NPDC052896 TaxID=3364061 RepID=UPI0037CC5658
MNAVAQAPVVRSPRPFAGVTMVRLLAQVMLLIGLVGSVGAVAYAVNGVTQAGGYVNVPVKVRSTTGLTVAGGSGGAAAQVPLGQGTAVGGQLRVDIAGTDRSSWLTADSETLTLRSFGSTVGEQLLSRAGLAALGLGVGLGALLLRRLLLSIAQGEPFRSGNAARVAGLAGLTAVAGLVPAVAPGVAGALVLGRLGLGGDGSPVTSVGGTLPYVPLLVALLLLALAEAFRRGAELAEDVDGLV